METEETDPVTDLDPGTFWARLLERERHALACGALQPIQTEQSILTRYGVNWLVRRVSSLARKVEDRQRRPTCASAVPRTRECHADISVNALGFAGSLFVTTPEQMERVAASGPLEWLRATTT